MDDNNQERLKKLETLILSHGNPNNEQISRMTGLSAMGIGRIRRGESSLEKVETLEKFAAGFGVDISYFFVDRYCGENCTDIEPEFKPIIDKIMIVLRSGTIHAETVIMGATRVYKAYLDDVTLRERLSRIEDKIENISPRDGPKKPFQTGVQPSLPTSKTPTAKRKNVR